MMLSIHRFNRAKFNGQCLLLGTIGLLMGACGGGGSEGGSTTLQTSSLQRHQRQ